MAMNWVLGILAVNVPIGCWSLTQTQLSSGMSQDISQLYNNFDDDVQKLLKSDEFSALADLSSMPPLPTLDDLSREPTANLAGGISRPLNGFTKRKDLGVLSLAEISATTGTATPGPAQALSAEAMPASLPPAARGLTESAQQTQSLLEETSRLLQKIPAAAEPTQKPLPDLLADPMEKPKQKPEQQPAAQPDPAQVGQADAAVEQSPAQAEPRRQPAMRSGPERRQTQTEGGGNYDTAGADLENALANTQQLASMISKDASLLAAELGTLQGALQPRAIKERPSVLLVEDSAKPGLAAQRMQMSEFADVQAQEQRVARADMLVAAPDEAAAKPDDRNMTSIQSPVLTLNHKLTNVSSVYAFWIGVPLLMVMLVGGCCARQKLNARWQARQQRGQTGRLL